MVVRVVVVRVVVVIVSVVVVCVAVVEVNVVVVAVSVVVVPVMEVVVSVRVVGHPTRWKIQHHAFHSGDQASFHSSSSAVQSYNLWARRSGAGAGRGAKETGAMVTSGAGSHFIVVG